MKNFICRHCKYVNVSISSNPCLRCSGRENTASYYERAEAEAEAERIEKQLEETTQQVTYKEPSLPAETFLHNAVSIMAERAKQYDSPSGERSMGKCVSAFNTITGQSITEAEGWLLMQLLKDVRQWQKAGFHLDSAEDCIAYAALKAEAKQHEVEVVERMHQQ